MTAFDEIPIDFDVPPVGRARGRRVLRLRQRARRPPPRPTRGRPDLGVHRRRGRRRPPHPRRAPRPDRAAARRRSRHHDESHLDRAVATAPTSRRGRRSAGRSRHGRSGRGRRDAPVHGPAPGRVGRRTLAPRAGRDRRPTRARRSGPAPARLREPRPEAFDDPDRFDLHRNNSRHVAFGKGLHFCIGAALGRLEGQIVIPAVLRRFPELALTDPQPTWRPTFVTRQLATLGVSTTG